jgi:hypothetical protein
MKILINEKQYQYIYNTPDRPLLTEITFVENDIPENDDEDNIEVGDGGETKDPHNILYNITEIYVDKHIADLFDELFPLFSDKQKYIHDCDPFVVAFNEKLIEKIKESRLNGAMPKILKSLIRKHKTITFTIGQIKSTLSRQFDYVTCYEYFQDLRGY